MLLNELLDTKITGKVTIDNASFYQVKARIGGRVIVFEAEAHDDEDEKGVWGVTFLEQDDDGDMTTNATGSGSELKVFAFVKNCFMDLIKKRKPNLVAWSADHDGKNQEHNSRASVYRKLIKKFKVPGYNLSEQDIGGEVLFYFEKEGSNMKAEYVDD